MARSTDYVVYRAGSNAYNQSMTHEMPVGIYTGSGKTAREREQAACDAAREDHTVYTNQYLYAVPVSRCSQETLQNAHEEREAALAQREYNESLVR